MNFLSDHLEAIKVLTIATRLVVFLYVVRRRHVFRPSMDTSFQRPGPCSSGTFIQSRFMSSGQRQIQITKKETKQKNSKTKNA